MIRFVTILFLFASSLSFGQRAAPIDPASGLSLQAQRFITAAGTNTYTVTYTYPLSATYFSFLDLYIKFTNGNTGASTLNVNGLGAKAIKKNVSSALVSGDIVAGGVYELLYDGTDFQIVSATGTTNSNGWSLTGNTGTTPGPNYIGTNDNVGFEVKQNGHVDIYLTRSSTHYETILYDTTILSNAILIGASAGAGKVLTSDASGYATWQTPAASSQARAYLTAQTFTLGSTAGDTILKFLSASTDTMYRIGANMNILTDSSLAIAMKGIYTSESGNVVTQVFNTTSGTASNVNTSGVTGHGMDAKDIHVKALTNIFIEVIPSGTPSGGWATFNAGAIIQQE